MKSTVLLFFVAILIGSCSDIHRTKQLEQIDALVASVDSLETVLKKNELSEAKIMSDSIAEVENRFKLYYIPDTIDREVHQEINDLKQARKVLSHVNRDFENFTTGCGEMKESLRQLRYDVDNGDGDRKKYNEFIAFEQSKFDNLNRMGKDYVEQKDLSADRYNRLYDKWNAFSYEQKKLNRKKVGL